MRRPTRQLSLPQTLPNSERANRLILSDEGCLQTDLISAGRPDRAGTPGGQVIYGTAYGRAVGDELTMSVRTVHLRLSPQRPAGERNVWRARLEKTPFPGDVTQMPAPRGGQPPIAPFAAPAPPPAAPELVH